MPAVLTSTKPEPVDMTNTPNYALERSVKLFVWRAAGARNIVASVARYPGCARTAQRGR